MNQLFKQGDLVMVEVATMGTIEEEAVIINTISDNSFTGMEALTKAIKWYNMNSTALHAVRSLREDERRIIKQELEILAERAADAKQFSKSKGEADNGDCRGEPVSLKMEAHI